MAVGTHAQRFCGFCRNSINTSKSSYICCHGSDLSLEDLPENPVLMSGEHDPPVVVHDACFHLFRNYAHAFFDDRVWYRLHDFCRRVRVTHPALHDLGTLGNYYTCGITNSLPLTVFTRKPAMKSRLGRLPQEILRTILDTLRSFDLINLGKTGQQFFLLCSEAQGWVPRNLRSNCRWPDLQAMDEVIEAANHCGSEPLQRLGTFACSLPRGDFKLVVHWLHMWRTRYVSHIEVLSTELHQGFPTYLGQSRSFLSVRGAENYVLAFNVDAYGLRDLTIKHCWHAPSAQVDASVFSGAVTVKAGDVLPLSRMTYDGLSSPLLQVVVNDLKPEDRLVFTRHAVSATTRDLDHLMLDPRSPSILMPVTTLLFPDKMQYLEMQVRQDFSVTGLRATSFVGITREIGRLDPHLEGDEHARQIMELEPGEHIVALLRTRKNDKRTFQLHSNKATVRDFGFGVPLIPSDCHDFKRQRTIGLCVIFGLRYQVLDLQAIREGDSIQLPE